MKNRQDCVIGCFKDSTVKVIKESKLSKHTNLKFLLIPILGFNSAGYIYVKSSDIINNFHHAKIEWSLRLDFYEDAMPSFWINIDDVCMETISLIEFINRIQNYNRYQHLTSFENCYIVDKIPTQLEIVPERLHIVIYDEKDCVIYESIIEDSYADSDKYAILDRTLDDILGNSKYFKKLGEGSTFLNFRNNKWSFNNLSKLRENDTVGIGYNLTRTVVFIEYEDMWLLIQHVKDIAFTLMIVDYHEIDFSNGRPDILSTVCHTVALYKAVETWSHRINEFVCMVDAMSSYSKTLESVISLFVNKFASTIHVSDTDIGYVIMMENSFLSTRVSYADTYVYRDDELSIYNYIDYIKGITKLL